MWEGKLWSRGQELRYKELLVRGLGYDGVLLKSLDIIIVVVIFIWECCSSYFSHKVIFPLRT